MSGRVHVTVTISQARWLASLPDKMPIHTNAELPIIESVARAARRALDWKERKTREAKE